MSERGSFVTEFIYCPECLAKLNSALGGLQVINLLSGHGNNQGVLAGRISGSYPGEELVILDNLISNIVICHRVRIAVIAEQGQKLIILKPASSLTTKNVCIKCKASPPSHLSGDGTNLCCKCYVEDGNPPADWHSECMKTYARIKSKPTP